MYDTKKVIENLSIKSDSKKYEQKYESKELKEKLDDFIEDISDIDRDEVPKKPLKYVESLSSISYSNNFITKDTLYKIRYSDDIEWNRQLAEDIKVKFKVKNIPLEKINLEKYTIKRTISPIIRVPYIKVEHNYIINLKNFHNHKEIVGGVISSGDYLKRVPKFETNDNYRNKIDLSSTEENIVRFYKTKLYSSTDGESNISVNEYSQNLVDRLNTEDKMESEKLIDYKKRLAILAARSFYTNDSSNKNTTRKIKVGKETINIRNIKVSPTVDWPSNILSKSVITFSGKDLISMKKSLFNGLVEHGQFVKPYIDLNRGRKNYKIITEDSSNFNLRASLEATTRVYNNKAVNCLLRSMPNFSPNMYFGIFSQYDLRGTGEIITDFNKISNTIGENTLGKEKSYSIDNVLSTYYVRLQSVSIPKSTLVKEEITFMGRKIPKISSKFKEEHTTTLTFSLDQYGMILRQFNLLSGIFSYKEDGFGVESNYNDLLESAKAGELYPKTFFPARFFESSNENEGNRLDFTVMYNDYRTNNEFNSLDHHSSFRNEQKFITNNDGLVEDVKQKKVLGKYNSYRAFIFEDVRILGAASPINFERDSSKSLTIQIPIMFKRIKTIDANP